MEDWDSGTIVPIINGVDPLVFGQVLLCVNLIGQSTMHYSYSIQEISIV